MSNAVKTEERKSNANFDWMHKPPIKAYHNEHAESSGQQGSNAKLIEIMKRMEQNMIERDNKFRAQLQMRDEYFDAEITIRD